MTVKPTQAQLNWQEKEFGMFCHFGINTYYEADFLSDCSFDPANFNPSRLDARQWVETAKEAGMKYMVLTAKRLRIELNNANARLSRITVCKTGHEALPRLEKEQEEQETF